MIGTGIRGMSVKLDEVSVFPMFLHWLNNSDDPLRRLRRYGYLLVMVILVLATWRRYSNWPGIFDITLWDETWYMNMGRSCTFNFMDYTSSPLNGFYYYIVSLFTAHPKATDLFFIGGLAVQIISLCSIGVSVWILSRSIAITTFVFGLILCSPFLLESIRNSYLAVIFVLLGSAFAVLENRLANRLALTMLVSFIICFGRPEFVLSLYLAGVALFVVLIGRTVPEVYKAAAGRIQVEDQSVYRLAAYLLLTGLLCLAWSFPSPQGGRRAMVAYGQNYARYWVSEHNSLLNPYLNYKSIVEKMFPGIATPTQAVLSNPSEWMRFTIHNMLGAIPTMGSLVLVRENVITAAGLLALLSVAAWSMHNRTRLIGLSSTLKAMPLVESALYAVAPLSGVVFLYSEPRFAVILLAALMPCCVAVGQWHSWSKVTDLLIALLAAAAIAVVVRPLPITVEPTLEAIIALRNLNLPIRRMLEVDGGWCFYLNPPCTPEWRFLNEIDPEPPTHEPEPGRRPLFDKVDAIMVSDQLFKFWQGGHDQSLDELSRAMSGTEWRRYDLGAERYLLHRETPIITSVPPVWGFRLRIEGSASP
jgi:hypothetical protein